MKILSRLLAYLACAAFLVQPAIAQVVPSIPFNLTNGSVADATQVMGNFNTIVTDVNANAATNGINTNITSLTGLTTPLAPQFGGTALYTGGTSGGSANAQTLASVVPSNFALTMGNIITGIAGFSNSGATTLSVNGGAVTAMRKKASGGLVALSGGEIITGSPYTWYYDGTFYDLLNPTNAANAVGGPGSSVSGDVASFNGTGGNVIQDAGILSTSLVRTIHHRMFTSTTTYTPTAGTLYAIAECVGSGGSGAGGDSGGSENGGGGGGGGEYGNIVLSAATIGASQTATIGAAATGGAGNSNGADGNVTSLGTLLSCGGGKAGVHSSTVALGGLGGNAAGAGDYHIPGGAGGTTVGGSGTAAGFGGTSFFGVGALATAGSNMIGNNGLGFGGGGGGGTGTASGGNSTAGVIIITEFTN